MKKLLTEWRRFLNEAEEYTVWLETAHEGAVTDDVWDLNGVDKAIENVKRWYADPAARLIGVIRDSDEEVVMDGDKETNLGKEDKEYVRKEIEELRI